MTDLILTEHASVRMAQRGVSIPDAELIMLVGTEVSDGYFVRTQDCQHIETQLKHLCDRVRRLQGKRLVVREGRIVTAYRTTRRNQRRLLQYAQDRDLSE